MGHYHYHSRDGHLYRKDLLVSDLAAEYGTPSARNSNVIDTFFQ